MGKQWKSTTARNEGIITTTVEEISESTDNQQIAAIAFEFWQARGCPEGSPEEDWFRAEETLKNRKESISTAGAA